MSCPLCGFPSGSQGGEYGDLCEAHHLEHDGYASAYQFSQVSDEAHRAGGILTEMHRKIRLGRLRTDVYDVSQIVDVNLSMVRTVRDDEHYKQLYDVLAQSVLGRPGTPPLPYPVDDKNIKTMKLVLKNPEDETFIEVKLDSWWAFILANIQNVAALTLAENGETMFHHDIMPYFELHVDIVGGRSILLCGCMQNIIGAMVLMAPREKVLLISDHLVDGVETSDDPTLFTDEYINHIVIEAYTVPDNVFGFFSYVKNLREFMEDIAGRDPDVRFVIQASRGNKAEIFEVGGDAELIEMSMSEIIAHLS